MALILCKWLLCCSLFITTGTVHPIYVSVTEIEHNSKDKTLEISCKIYTDDFEKTLRLKNNTKIDLLDEKMHKSMEPLVNNYISKHLQISIDGVPKKMQWIGFEKKEEGIVSYFQVDNITSLQSITVVNNILYEYKSEQISLIHAIVKGNRKSTRMFNPEDKAVFNF